MFRSVLIVPAVLAGLLAGCSSVVLPTAVQMRSVSPLDADPADYEIALDLPNGLDLQPGSEQLRLSATRSDTRAELGQTFVLERRAASNGAPEADGRLAFYRVAPADLPRFRLLQADIAEMKQAAPDATKGSLSISLEGCRLGAGPTSEATGAVWIRTVREGPFLPLVRNGPVDKLLQAEDLMPCDG